MAAGSFCFWDLNEIASLPDLKRRHQKGFYVRNANNKCGSSPVLDILYARRRLCVAGFFTDGSDVNVTLK